MRAVKRSAVIVMPAQPFLDWLHQADPTSVELTLEDLRHEPTFYLLLEYDTEEEARNHLKKPLPGDLRRTTGGLASFSISLASETGFCHLQPLV